MKVTASLPTGVAALLFEGAEKRRELERQMVEHLESQDFREVILPVVDYLEPYNAMLSERSRAELYRFVDRDGELLALRADFTPMLARLLAPHLDSVELPLHVYYRGDVLRYQEERAGRQRELYQLGAEVLGPADDEAGRRGEEVALERFLECLQIGERSHLTVVVGFAGALDRLLLERTRDDDGGQDNGVTELVDAIVRRERRHARRAGDALLQVVENGVPDDPSTLGEEAARRLVRLQKHLDELDRRFPHIDLRLDLAEFADQVVDPDLYRIVGNRAYYDGLVFRAFTDHASEPVGNGGRYDRLFGALGAEVSATGFGFSLDRLVARPSAATARAAAGAPAETGAAETPEDADR